MHEIRFVASSVRLPVFLDLFLRLETNINLIYKGNVLTEAKIGDYLKILNVLQSAI